MSPRETLDAALDAFLRDEGVVRPFQHAFFDEFTERRIHDSLAVFPRASWRTANGAHEFQIHFTRLRLGEHPVEPDSKKSVYPDDVRGMGSASYDVEVYVDARVTLDDQQREFAVKCADLPVMVRSKRCTLSRGDAPKHRTCEFEPGGYFVVNGLPVVIVTQEQHANDKIFRARDKSTGTWRVGIRSVSPRRFVCKHTDAIHRPSDFAIKYTPANGKFTAHHREFPKRGVALAHLLAALGAYVNPRVARRFSAAELDRDKATRVVADAMRETKSAAVRDATTKERAACTTYFLTRELLPHVDSPDISKTAEFVQYMVEELLACVNGARGDDSLDDLAGKRFETCDVLLFELWASLFEKWATTCTRSLVSSAERDIDDDKIECTTASASRVAAKFSDMFTCAERHFARNNIITAGVRTALCTGVWAGARRARARVDVAEYLRGENAAASIEHMRKSVVPKAARARLASAQQFHPTQEGFVCPSQSPDGDKTGFVKHAALCAMMSRPATLDVDWSSAPAGEYRVVANGRIVAANVDGNAVAATLRKARGKTNSGVARDVGVTVDSDAKVIDVRYGGGRYVQALCRVSILDLPARVARTASLEWLVHNEYVDILDAHEIWHDDDPVVVAAAPEDARSSASEDFCTHVQMCGASFLSVLAACVPYANHNQSPRLSFYMPGGKQAVPPPYAGDKGMRTASYALWYAQRATTTTKIDRALGFADSPNGMIVNVAIASHPATQEDAVVFSSGFFQRGAFTIYSKHASRVEFNVTAEEPVPHANCDALGIILPNTRVSAGDVLISKRDRVTKADTSCRVKNMHVGFVERVKVSVASDARETSARKTRRRNGGGGAPKFILDVCVELRRVHTPETGDKFSMRHGQKAVVGKIVNDEDMIFVCGGPQNGMRPDMIINPHAFPTRLTNGLFMELAFSKYAYVDGVGQVDATAFERDFAFDLRDIAAACFEHYGMLPNCTHRFIDGATGQLIATPLVMGPLFLHRQIKLADLAQYWRAHGPRNSMTKQPTHGKANDGALRFGEMEVYALQSHGAAAMLVDRNVESCDLAEYDVCSACGRMFNGSVCGECRTSEHKSTVRVKHATHLARMELGAAGIDLKCYPSQ